MLNQFIQQLKQNTQGHLRILMAFFKDQNYRHKIQEIHCSKSLKEQRDVPSNDKKADRLTLPPYSGRL